MMTPIIRRTLDTDASIKLLPNMKPTNAPCKVPLPRNRHFRVLAEANSTMAFDDIVMSQLARAKVRLVTAAA